MSLLRCKPSFLLISVMASRPHTPILFFWVQYHRRNVPKRFDRNWRSGHPSFDLMECLVMSRSSTSMMRQTRNNTSFPTYFEATLLPSSISCFLHFESFVVLDKPFKATIFGQDHPASSSKAATHLSLVSSYSRTPFLLSSFSFFVSSFARLKALTALASSLRYSRACSALSATSFSNDERETCSAMIRA